MKGVNLDDIEGSQRVHSSDDNTPRAASTGSYSSGENVRNEGAQSGTWVRQPLGVVDGTPDAVKAARPV